MTPEVLPDKIPAGAMLEGLRDGQVVEEIGEALREMSQLVLLHQKKGVVTIKFIIEPLPGNQIIVADDITGTPPKAALPSTIRFVDRVGNLRTSDPEAMDLMSKLRSIEAGERQVRTIDGGGDDA